MMPKPFYTISDEHLSNVLSKSFNPSKLQLLMDSIGNEVTDTSHNTIYVPLKNVQVKLNRNAISINNENLDIELLKLLYQSYYHNKFKLDQQQHKKPAKENLRVKYFDDFNLFHTNNNNSNLNTEYNDNKMSSSSCNELFFNKSEKVFPTDLKPDWKTLRKMKFSYVGSDDEVPLTKNPLPPLAAPPQPPTTATTITTATVTSGTVVGTGIGSGSTTDGDNVDGIDLRQHQNYHSQQQQSQQSQQLQQQLLQGKTTSSASGISAETSKILTNAMRHSEETSTQTTMTVASSVLENVEGSQGEMLSGSTVKVQLERLKDTSFGICIVGGQVNLAGNNKIIGVFIKNIIPGSPADKCGLLKIGDRLVAVDDVNLRDASHQFAVSVIKNAGLSISLIIERFNKWQNDIFNVYDGETDDKLTALDKSQPPPVTPSKTPECILVQGSATDTVSLNESVDERDQRDTKATIIKITDEDGQKDDDDDDEVSSSSDDEDSRDMTGRIVTKGGVEVCVPKRIVTPITTTATTTSTIDRASAGNVKLNKTEMAKGDEIEDEFGYTTLKLKKRYGALGNIFQHQLLKTDKTSMGISLAGHRDRNKMACFIAGINPKGIAAQSDLRVGDEILEVNGIVLHGRSHLNASAIIKSLPGPMVKFILLRKDRALEDLAVKPVTQFPIHLGTEAEMIATNFKNVRTLSMQKAAQSLGIMIIEGKHSDVGQGIFVSDIQEGSIAEKAGLAVGDMILSVNNDSLLGCSYETAASLLKKTEGLVLLKICNPNKKEKSEEMAELLANGGSGGLQKKSLEKPKSKDDELKATNISQPVTPKSHKSAKDLASEINKEITANKESIIEILADKKPLGINVVGGCDTLIKNGAVIIQIYKNGIAEKDNRLKVFDQILEMNGTKLSTDKTNEQMLKVVRQSYDKLAITIWRSDPPNTQSVEIDLIKRSGKDLGLGFTDGNSYGIIVSQILPGGVADIDGRIQKGDIITHINGDSLVNVPMEQCCVLLKTCQGKATLKILRPAPKKHDK